MSEIPIDLRTLSIAFMIFCNGDESASVLNSTKRNTNCSFGQGRSVISKTNRHEKCSSNIYIYNWKGQFMTKRSRKMRKNKAILEAKTTWDLLLSTIVLANIQLEATLAFFLFICRHRPSLEESGNDDRFDLFGSQRFQAWSRSQWTRPAQSKKKMRSSIQSTLHWCWETTYQSDTLGSSKGNLLSSDDVGDSSERTSRHCCSWSVLGWR